MERESVCDSASLQDAVGAAERRRADVAVAGGAASVRQPAVAPAEATEHSSGHLPFCDSQKFSFGAERVQRRFTAVHEYGTNEYMICYMLLVHGGTGIWRRPPEACM